MKWFIQFIGLVTFGMLAGCISSEKPPTPFKDAELWHTNIYSKIGLEIATPDWKVDIREHNDLWTLFAIPLVDVPVVSDQYGITIQIRKIQEKDHRSYYPVYNGSADDGKWMNSQHLDATQHNNAYWIWSRRDLFGTNGWAYYCVG